MFKYITQEYQDADGNRGVDVINIELDEYDKEYIKEDMIEYIKQNQPEYTGSMVVSLIDDITEEDCQFEESFDEYFSKEEFNKLLEPEE